VPGDFAQRFGQERPAGWDLVPGRCAGWMRQRDQIHILPRTTDVKRAADDVFQFGALDELSDGQASDRNDQTRFKNRDFLIQPGRAIADFIRRRNPIAASGIFSGKTPTNRREINGRPDLNFG